MIEVKNINKHFGGLKAVDNVNMRIETGSITGLIGPNGAGKTTLFNVIAGLHKPTSGTVFLEGQDITGMEPHELFAKRVLRTFQIAHEFPTLTVRENLMMVPDGQVGESLLNAWFKPKQVREHEQKVYQKATEVIEFLEIAHIADELAGNISGGQKKLLELGRTMMVDARIVFLDEVGAGVNRTLLKKIGEAIVRLRDERGYTFCLIEHDMDFMAQIADHVVCMADGAIMAEGTVAEIKANEQVIEAYLGTGTKSKRAPRK